MSTTLQEIHKKYHQILDEYYGSSEVDSFFYWVLEHYLNLSKVQYLLNPKRLANDNDKLRLYEVLSELKDFVPIQYILGETEFYGMRFYLTDDVLIPRPETEELVAWILQEVKHRNTPLTILDLGTGSGCIAISLAKHLPHSEVHALDVSKEALAIARRNAQLHQVDIIEIHHDIIESRIQNSTFNDLKFDIIVSNPPYVRHSEKTEMRPNVLNYEPHIALFVDDNNPLLFYEAIIAIASSQLKSDGLLFFEINQYLGQETCDLLSTNNFKNLVLKTDLSGNDRMIKAQYN
jgi:release factor glutamine methyltransferase